MDAYSMIPPEGYWKVSVEQLHRADLQLFKVMMRETRSRSGIKPLGGNKPMEAALRKAMDAAEVRLYLQPLQGVAQRKVEPVQEDDAKKTKSNDIAKLQKTVENLQGQLKNIRDSGSSSSQGKGKAKGHGKNKGNMIRMPPQLIGLSPTTPQGDPICYGYNLKGCNKAKHGERCAKGWHTCMRWGCNKAHPQTEHQ